MTTLINGNSGKSPAGTPAAGGFTGWTMLGIDPAAGDVGTAPSTQDRVDWLAAETHPWVDEISVQAPRKLTVGGVGDASASFSQDGRTVPVAWPVTSQWGGEGVQVLGEGAESSDRRGVVRLNPTTGEITGMRPGTATLSVTVNGRTATSTVEVAGR